MISTVHTLSEFFGGFGIPVYMETDVPDDAQAPYITIPIKEPEWRTKTSFPVLVWYRTKSNVTVLQKADEVIGAVGEGVRIRSGTGYLVLRMDTDTPAQVMVEGDFRCARIAMTLNAYHMPGE